MADRQQQRARVRGRGVDGLALSEVRELLSEGPRRRDLLIEYLHLIQDRFGAVAERHLAALCQEVRISLVEGYEVATFYPAFEVVGDDVPAKAPARAVCDGLPCELAGADALAAAGTERVRRVPCLGRCDSAPVAIGSTRRPEGRDDIDEYLRKGGYQLLRSCIDGARSIDSVIDALEASNLRGLGGAGFPTARKWRAVRAAPAPRYVVLNADESEPGTFKDRWLLERDPHRVLEGILLACWAVGAEQLYIYLRGEHEGLHAILRAALEQVAARRISDVKVDLRRGGGAYICGEETAMIESIEGKRGYPRNKPPYPSEVGLFGRPTLIQNVETMYFVRGIAEHGATWWSAEGRRGHSGMRHFSVSGRVRTPGVYLAPNGVTARELVEEFAGGMADGHRFAAYLPGGASGGMLPAALADEPLDVNTLQQFGGSLGSAGVIILSESDSPRLVARAAMRFFRNESCGQCTPCREGTMQAVSLMAEARWDTAKLEELSSCMADASICGLGQVAPVSLRSLARFWPESAT